MARRCRSFAKMSSSSLNHRDPEPAKDLQVPGSFRSRDPSLPQDDSWFDDSRGRRDRLARSRLLFVLLFVFVLLTFPFAILVPQLQRLDPAEQRVVFLAGADGHAELIGQR